MAEEKAKLSSLSMDGFNNFVAKLGLNTENLASFGKHTFGQMISRNRVLLEQIYRSSWIAGQVVDSIAEDMTKEGIEMHSSMSPDDDQALQSEITKLGVWESIGDAIKWSRLYGGAVAVILTDGADYSKPLDITRIGRGVFRGIVPLDRWQLQPSMNDLITNIGSDMGRPKFYKVLPSMETMSGINIHYSRLIRFDGIEMPYYQRKIDNLWGMSVIERLYDRLLAFDSATTGAAQLLYKAYLRVVQIDGLRQALSMGGQTEQAVIKQFHYIRLMQSIEGITLLDSSDKFETHNYTFAGVSDILQQFGQQISGATGIPLVRLFGQSPAGFSATGESDLRNYYDNILRLQESTLRSGVYKFLSVMSMSLFGKPLPEDFEFDFVSLWSMGDGEKAQIAATLSQTIAGAYQGGLITKKIAMKELSQQSRITGLFTSITDEDIANAKEDQPPMMGGMGGEGGEPPLDIEGTKKFIQKQEEDKTPDKKSLVELEKELEDIPDVKEESIENLEEELESIPDMENNEEPIENLEKELESIPDVGNSSLEDLEKELKDIPDVEDSDKSLEDLEKELKSIPDISSPNKSFEGLEKELDALPTYSKDGLISKVFKKARNIFRGEQKRVPKGTIKKPLIKDFKEEDHPRSKSGPTAGQFIKKGTSTSVSPKKAKEKKIEPKEAIKKAPKYIYYPAPKKTKGEANFLETKRTSKPEIVKNKKGNEVWKFGDLVLADGKELPDHIKGIPIPPAWQHIRINPDPNGKMLIAGTDQKGQRQRKYSKAHDNAEMLRNFKKVASLEKNISDVVKNIEKNYETGNKEEALCLRFIEQTGARADSERGSGDIKTFGASSIQNRHLKINKDGSVTAVFTGKSGVENSYTTSDPFLVKILSERAKRPDKKQRVFDTKYSKLYSFSTKVSPGKFTPKNFRTRVACNLAKDLISNMPVPTNAKEYKKSVFAVGDYVSSKLCNTRTVCLDKYIDPEYFKPWKKSSGVKTTDRWITIKSKEGDRKGYRRILLNEKGIIEGGDVPKEVQGTKIGSKESREAFEKAQEKDVLITSKEIVDKYLEKVKKGEQKERIFKLLDDRLVEIQKMLKKEHPDKSDDDIWVMAFEHPEYVKVIEDVPNQYSRDLMNLLKVPKERRPKFRIKALVFKHEDFLKIHEWTKELASIIDKKGLSDTISNRELQVYITGEGRSSYVNEDWGGSIYLSSLSKSEYFHEFGHFLENNNATVKYRCRNYLKSRTEGEEEVPLKNYNEHYGDNEVCKPDKFLSPYVGKVYQSKDTEVFSMGLDYLIRSPEKFVKQDPDHFEFTLKMLRGEGAEDFIKSVNVKDNFKFSDRLSPNKKRRV